MTSSLFERQPLAMWAGTVSFALFLITTALAAVDDTQILGIDRWIKPAKFFISIAIFMWTMGVYLYYLQGQERFSQRVSSAMIVIFTVEMIAIVGQATRGTTSHFNVATGFNRGVYAVMGVAIVINTVLVGVILYRYLTQKVDLSPTLLLGMRLGLALFLVGSVIGGYMSAQTGHTVGAADGGPGLSFTNWSTVAGDLRVAHFLGLHALQAVPLFAVVLDASRISRKPFLVAAFAAGYLTVTAALFIEALAGRPFIAI